MLSLKLVRRLAVFIGAFCILGETVRRWHTWTDWPPSFFDDYCIGALLFYGAWRSSRDEQRGQAFLAAAWGFACGQGYASFFGHLKQALLEPGLPDPHTARLADRAHRRGLAALHLRARLDAASRAVGRLIVSNIFRILLIPRPQLAFCDADLTCASQAFLSKFQTSRVCLVRHES